MNGYVCLISCTITDKRYVGIGCRVLGLDASRRRCPSVCRRRGRVT